VTNGGTITIASVGSNNLWVRFTDDLTNLTRVKLSPGTEASGFVARPFGTELALCQRYYFKITAGSSANYFGMGQGQTTASVYAPIVLPVEMRAAPTALDQTGTAADYSVRTGTTNTTCSGVPALLNAGTSTSVVVFSVSSGITVGAPYFLRAISANAFLAWSAEL
jgi:hypothetical protein